MKQKLCLFAIHQITTSLQWTYNLNPRTRWYPVLDESNWVKFAYFASHLGKNPPPRNGCRLNLFFLKSTNFTSSTFPIQPDFSQNQPATITLNTGSPRTLGWYPRFPTPTAGYFSNSTGSSVTNWQFSRDSGQHTTDSNSLEAVVVWSSVSRGDVWG